MNFTGFAIVDFGALAEVYPHGNDGTFFDNDAFHDFRTCANKAVVFNDGRVSLQRLQYAADTYAAGKVNIFTNLRAGTHRRPGVNHGAFVNVGADVNVRRHQHGVAGDKCALTNGRRRNDAEAFFLKTRFVVISEFHRDFIEVAAFRTVDNLVIVNTEREQNRFLQPLVSDPLTVDFFCDTQRAGIK